MAFLLATATAALLVQPVCSWDRPGVDRYRGTPAAALAHYRDIPAADRAALAQRINAGTPDDMVRISRTAIAGHHQYEARIADMHFGTGRLCRTVTRARWKPAHSEAAAVYCVNGECVLVPEVCGNVSRIRKIVTSGTDSPGATGGAPPPPDILPPTLQAAPIPSYPAVPPSSDELPPWAESAVPFLPVPLLGNPSPGRELSNPMPLPLAPVPEPSTWAMLLGGLAMLALGGWRRRTAERPGRSGAPL